jgi:hypothetical protein
VLERRKSVTTGRTNEPNGQQKSYIPQSFFGGGMQILSKINFKYEINKNKTKRNEINETKRNQRNENEMKRNQRKQNEIN